MNKPLIILTGPTAVGKTDLSIRLAKEIGAEIISADSMQVYKTMDIGTAKISVNEMQGVTHHLIDIREPEEGFDVATFKTLANEAINKIYSNGHIPLIVGGTGFYIQAVLYNVDFTETGKDSEYRDYLNALAKEHGNEYIHNMLTEVDEESAKNIHANNLKRVIRALEFYKETGTKISEHNEKEGSKKSPYNFCYFVLNDDRQILYDRIDKRVDDMFESGLEDEVSQLIERGLKREDISMQGIGYKEFFDFYDGIIDKNQLISNIKQDTRHFAKRQLTWFRREPDVCMININEYNSRDEVFVSMLNILKEKGVIQ